MDIVNEIVRMVETGQLDLSKENHKHKDHDIRIEKKNFNDHGIDGLIIEINLNGNKVARILYDAWSRSYIKDNEPKICRTT